VGEWATGIVEDWPDDPRQAVIDPVKQEHIVRLAASIATIGRDVTRPVHADSWWTAGETPPRSDGATA
jgi:hypothetical protein